MGIYILFLNSGQFFESVNPLSGFESKEKLETYMWEKSLKIEPKDADKWDVVKPTRPSSVLRSPGIKPPKNLASLPSTSGISNHYGRYRRSGRFSALTNSYSPGNLPDAFDASRNSLSSTSVEEKNTHFGVVDIVPGQSPRYLGDVWRSPRPLSPLASLKPPPLMPRLRKQKASSTPPSPHIASSGIHDENLSQAPPPLFPRKRSPLCSTTSPGDLNVHTQRLPSIQKECTRFIFPPAASSDRKISVSNFNEVPSTSSVPLAPIVPPRKKEEALPPPIPLDAVRTIWNKDVADGAGDADFVPSKAGDFVEIISPPPLFPRRSASRCTPPPPRPPKRISSTGSGPHRGLPLGRQAEPDAAKTSADQTSPPPLPPKTYRLQRH
ncbi:unnamed protein product [Enterobius vermicularis]|uniref:SH3 domain-containing protein n=1 Tax=Enterobius vermicularis TaxID=51028 RepID=A0A0N4VML2_ENTVE|nr:unnamed protein product [Enterobius vermicularis]